VSSVSVAAVVFVATLAYAFAALPDPVAVYFGPATLPDVEYPVYWYITTMAISGPLLAWGISELGRKFFTIAEQFESRVKAGRERFGYGAVVVRSLIFSWALGWLTGVVWLAVGLGNSHHVARSLLELLFGSIAFAGIFVVIIAWALLYRSRRRRDASTRTV
jgi:membrane protein DedA with SNARE-associated domain